MRRAMASSGKATSWPVNAAATPHATDGATPGSAVPATRAAAFFNTSNSPVRAHNLHRMRLCCKEVRLHRFDPVASRAGLMLLGGIYAGALLLASS